MSERKIYSWANWVTGRVGGSGFPHPFMFLAAESFFERRLEAPGSFVPASEIRKESNGVAGAPLCRGEDDFSQLGPPICSAAMHRESDSWKIFGRSAKARYWKVVCSCGVTYLLKESSEPTSPLMTPFRYGLQYQQCCQTLLAKGVRMSAVARELGLSAATVLHWKRRAAGGVKLPAEELVTLRAEWRELVKSAPSSNRISSATRMGRATRSKLERFDREWILEFNRQNRSPRRGGKSDVERDNLRSELFRQTQQRIRAASDMLKQVEPPVHVTRAAIVRKAGLRGPLALDSSQYSELLAELSESRAAYIERVIVWMTALSERQPLRNIDEACTLAGLYRNSFTKEQKARICSLLSKDSHSS